MENITVRDIDSAFNLSFLRRTLNTKGIDKTDLEALATGLAIGILECFEREDSIEREFFGFPLGEIIQMYNKALDYYGLTESIWN